MALEADRPASLLKFAEHMVKEAEKQSETIQREAEAEAKQNAEDVVADAVSVAKAKSNEILTKAERESQNLLKRAREEADELLKVADLKAEDRLAASASESQVQARQFADSVADEIRSTVAKRLVSGGEASPDALSGKVGRNSKASANGLGKD